MLGPSAYVPRSFYRKWSGDVHLPHGRTEFTKRHGFNTRFWGGLANGFDGDETRINLPELSDAGRVTQPAERYGTGGGGLASPKPRTTKRCNDELYQLT